MEVNELLKIIEKGEDSLHQFKSNITNPESLASELVAFSNALGGMIIIGVDDFCKISGLTSDDVQRINQMISNVSSQHIHPPINPFTENILTDQGHVLIVNIQAGLNKPYQDKNSIFWVKFGSDKRKTNSREELQRMFQESNIIHADAMPVDNTSIEDINIDYFKKFYLKKFEDTLELNDVNLEKLLENMNLMKNGKLSIAGVLLFAKNPEFKLPLFIVNAIYYNSNEVSDDEYNDNKNIEGNLQDVFRETVKFIRSNLHYIQGGQSVNSIGIPEIPLIAVEEIVANALIHRNYFISSSIKVFIFRNRVEVISPGHLPNQLTIENIKNGNSNPRNPILSSYGNYLITYRGVGTGIIRALKSYPHIDFIDDRQGNLFKVIFKRITP